MSLDLANTTTVGNKMKSEITQIGPCTLLDPTIEFLKDKWRHKEWCVYWYGWGQAADVSTLFLVVVRKVRGKVREHWLSESQTKASRLKPEEFIKRVEDCDFLDGYDFGHKGYKTKVESYTELESEVLGIFKDCYKKIFSEMRGRNVF